MIILIYNYTSYSWDSAVKSFSVQQIGNENSPTPNFSSLSAESATKRPQTPAVNDAKAEKKRKRRERKEREARKFEEARLKEQDKLEKERQVAELSRNRSLFNGNKDTLPSIGRRTADVSTFYINYKMHHPRRAHDYLFAFYVPKLRSCEYSYTVIVCPSVYMFCSVVNKKSAITLL